MNKYILSLLIKKNQKKLNNMILKKEKYDKIIEQSQKLDKYIYLNLKNQIKRKNNK